MTEEALTTAHQVVRLTSAEERSAIAALIPKSKG